MNDSIGVCKGHFKLTVLDKYGNVLDEEEDKNLIMDDARFTMGEIFANKSASNTFVNNLRIGTLGHVGADILTPKTTIDGFLSVRDRMFSDSQTHVSGTTININVGDLIDVGGIYYTYNKPIANSQYALNATTLAADFTQLTGKPYTYDLNFDIPTVYNSLSGVGDAVSNFSESDVGAGSVVTVLQSGSSLTINAAIAIDAANKQDLISSVFTEAALYANGRIFSLKVFKAKIKDASVTINISWTITF